MSQPLFVGRVTFVVPSTSGNYAPERLNFASSTPQVPTPGLLGVTALVESTVAGAVVEMWLLRVGGDPTASADFFYSGLSITAGSETWPLALYPGAQLRVKSGGTAGNVVVSGSAD